MTIEEKAKAYDEALERAKNKLHYPDKPCFVDVTEIFPELKESEGERIVKAIKYALDYVFTNNTTVYETTKEQCLAWLEKQGEHANFRNKIQIGDKVTRNRDGMLVNLSQLNRVAKKDENQEYQKPAEWSEEDETIAKALTKAANDIVLYGYIDKSKLLEWLKELKDRVGYEANYTTTWLPSKEQMKWLHDAIESTQYEPRKQALISLYSDLMKLREE